MDVGRSVWSLVPLNETCHDTQLQIRCSLAGYRSRTTILTSGAVGISVNYFVRVGVFHDVLAS